MATPALAYVYKHSLGDPAIGPPIFAIIQKMNEVKPMGGLL
jgi:hypothetical protein